MPPDVPNQPAGNEEEDPEEIEGVFDLDSDMKIQSPKLRTMTFLLGASLQSATSTISRSSKLLGLTFLRSRTV